MDRFLPLLLVFAAATCLAAPPDAPTIKVVFDARFGSAYPIVDPIRAVVFTCNKDSAMSNATAGTIWACSGPYNSRIQVRARESTAGKCIWDTLITDVDGQVVSQSHLVVVNNALGIYTGPQFPSNFAIKSWIRCVELGTFTISP